MDSATVSGPEGELAYKVYNPGKPRTILCFHGFGLGPEMFATLADKHPDITFFCPQLLGHGTTRLSENNFTTSAFVHLLTKALDQNNVSEFEMAGYSLGARYLLGVWEHFSSKVRKVYLLAPAGLVPESWFNFATGTPVQNRFFHFVMHSPGMIHSIANISNRLGLISQIKYDLTMKFIENETLRSLIYEAWTGAAIFNMTSNDIIRIANSSGSEIDIILAKEDVFIDEVKIQKIATEFTKARLVITEIRHNSLAQFDFLQASN